jgi:hypothetical protein
MFSIAEAGGLLYLFFVSSPPPSCATPQRSARNMDQPEWPLFVFLDDTSLEICESLEDARREYEGIDVEAGVYSFFDYAGAPVKPVFIVPNVHSKFLGLISSCSSGVFEFERDSTSESNRIASKLNNTEHLTKNQRFETLYDVCRHLERRGCCMDHCYSNRELTQAEPQR